MEPRYARGIYEGTGSHPGQVRYVDGDTRVLFTAANGVHYYRGQTKMPASWRTGSLAETLAALTGHASLTVVREPAGPAPRLIETLQSALIEHVHPPTFVIDLKGMKDRDIDVGVGLGPIPGAHEEAMAQFIVTRMSALGLRAAVNTPFSGSSPATVTRFCQESLLVPAVQVALSAWLRDPAQNATIARLTLTVLRDAATHVTA